MAKIVERELTVLESLKNNEKLSTEDVAALLGISESSARRLFLSLEKGGKVVRVYGGIQLAKVNTTAYSFMELKNMFIAEKRTIARHTATLLADNDTIYLDSGTTLFQLAIAIKERIVKNELHDIRVITNSFANMEVLGDACNVILIGGNYRPKRKDFAGYASERFLQCFRYCKAFLGADGFDLEEGFMGTDTDTARLNEILLVRSEEVFVLIDSSKIGIRSFITYAEIDQIKAVITDDRISAKTLAECAHRGLTIIKAELH